MYADDGSIFSQLTLEEISKLKKKEIRAKVGRKLAFREWFGLKVIKSNYRKAKSRLADNQKESRNGINGLSLAAFILSILGIIPLVGWPLGIIGFFLGIVALITLKKSKRTRGKGFAIAALVITMGNGLFLSIMISIHGSLL